MADLHPIIPFLLLGIGVDDMFVIVQSYNNADREDKGESLSNAELNFFKSALIAAFQKPFVFSLNDA